jgi:hypothetical protein
VGLLQDRRAPQDLRADLKASLALLRATVMNALPNRTETRTPTPFVSATAAIAPDAPATALYNARGLMPNIDPASTDAAQAGKQRNGAARSNTAQDEPLEQLLRLVEGALARTRVHQLAALHEPRPANESATNQPAWTVELPIPSPTGFDSLRLRLEENDNSRRELSDGARDWTVMLCLDCASLGPIHALVRLRGQRLGTTLWAERESTLRMARGTIEELELALRAQGVEVERLDCLPGKPPEPATLRFGGLLDVRT